MNNYKLQGLLFICAGIVLIIFGAGQFILRVLIVLAGLGLVNYGLRLRSEPPLIFFLTRLRSIFWL
jgi:small-conductance mechanosensitive channel